MKMPPLKWSVRSLPLLLLAIACTEQHDPTPQWRKFRHERELANHNQPVLTEDYKMPAAAGSDGAAANLSPGDRAYGQFCVSCHGEKGDGNGAAGASLNPKPRNFVAWNYKDIAPQYAKDVDGYIAKVIREGGPAVGKSPTMAAWGGVINDDQVIAELVKKVKSFRK